MWMSSPHFQESSFWEQSNLSTQFSSKSNMHNSNQKVIAITNIGSSSSLLVRYNNILGTTPYYADELQDILISLV